MLNPPIVDLLKKLVEIPSVHSRPHEIERCASFIAKYLTEADIQFQHFNYKGTPSILAGPQNREPKILLMSHFDVVEASKEMFLPREENGKLFGRGAIDDKYAIALSLELYKNIVEQFRSKGKSQDDVPLAILMTGDEETGGTNGANHVLGKTKPEFCIALDGGNINEIIVKEKGIAFLRLISRGRTSHGSRPWLGENAIDSLIKDYQEISKHFDLSSPNNWHRTINLSRIEAGRSFNQVPGKAEAILDIRFTENDDIDALIETFRNSIKSEIIILRKEPLFKADPSIYLDTLLTLNPEIETTAEHGSSDARFLSLHGLNGIVWGANGNLSHHSETEHVEIESLLTLYQKLDQFIKNSCELT